MDVRWNSYFRAIERLLVLRPALEKYCELYRGTDAEAEGEGEGSEDSQRGSVATVAMWELTSADWTFLSDVVRLLQPFRQVTMSLEIDSYPTVHVAGRVMLWLLYVCPALQGNLVGHAKGFVHAAK